MSVPPIRVDVKSEEVIDPAVAAKVATTPDTVRGTRKAQKKANVEEGSQSANKVKKPSKRNKDGATDGGQSPKDERAESGDFLAPSQTQPAPMSVANSSANKVKKQTKKGPQRSSRAGNAASNADTSQHPDFISEGDNAIEDLPMDQTLQRNVSIKEGTSGTRPSSGMKRKDAKKL